MTATRTILGTVQFGLPYGVNNVNGQPSEADVDQILSTAAERGVVQLDSADLYGTAQSQIGSFAKRSGVTFAVNSKFRLNGGETLPVQLERTLLQLLSDRLNVYFYHSFDELLAYPEAMVVLQELKQQGIVAKIGVSVYTNEEFDACIRHTHVDVIQFPFNLLDNRYQRGAQMKRAKDAGKELQARSIFLQGLFFRKPGLFPEALKPLEPYTKRLHELAAGEAISMQQLALSYAASQKEIDHILIGVDSVEQLHLNLDALSYSLSDPTRNEIDSIQVENEHLLYPYNWK